MKTFVNILISTLVIIAGFVGIIAVNLLGTILLKSLFGSGISAEGTPLTQNSIIVFLIMIFIAGMVGAFIIAILIKRKIWIHLGVFCGLAIIGDVLALKGQLVDFPIWAKIVVLITIPLQVWIGGKMGLWLKKDQN